MLTPGAKGAQSDVYTDAVLAELEAAYSSSKMRRTYCWPQVFADGRSYRHYVFAYIWATIHRAPTLLSALNLGASA
jgi:hypothetical protein